MSLSSTGRLAGIALLLALGAQSSAAHAALLFRGGDPIDKEEHRSPIRSYGEPSDTAYPRSAAAEEVHVFVSGPITREDVESAGVMAGLLEAGKQKITGNAVWLASDGGDVDAAMALGRLLRRLGVSTVI